VACAAVNLKLDQERLWLAPAMVYSVSENGANLLGMMFAQKKWPESDGWEAHQVEVYELTIDELLNVLKEVSRDALGDDVNLLGAAN
jgi:hypothetical protein